MFLGVENKAFEKAFETYIGRNKVHLNKADLDYVSELFTSYKRNSSCGSLLLYKQLSELDPVKDYGKFKCLVLTLSIELLFLKTKLTARRCLFLLDSLKVCANVSAEKGIRYRWKSMFQIASKSIDDVEYIDGNRYDLSETMCAYFLRYGIEPAIDVKRYKYSNGGQTAYNSIIYMYIALLDKHFKCFEINDLKDKLGRTLLMALATAGVHRDTIFNLIAMGADPDIKCKQGFKAINHAYNEHNGNLATYVGFFADLVGVNGGYNASITELVPERTVARYAKSRKTNRGSHFNVTFNSFYGYLCEYKKQCDRHGGDFNVKQGFMDYFHRKAAQELALISIQAQTIPKRASVGL